MNASRERKRRPVERPYEILEAALQVFGDRGYHAATLDDVARAAGVTKGAIYHHFESKGDLLLRAVSTRIREARKELERVALERELSAEQRIVKVARRLWHYFTMPEWATVFLLMLGELHADFPRLVNAWFENGPRYSWMVLEQLIREGQAAGEFAPDVDVEVAARALPASLTMQVLLQGVFKQPIPASDRVFEATMELFLCGLRRGQSSGEPVSLRPVRRARRP